ncbi:hypothetical protein MMPV_001252 [Pyropia vietnamensis]
MSSLTAFVVASGGSLWGGRTFAAPPHSLAPLQAVVAHSSTPLTTDAASLWGAGGVGLRGGPVVVRIPELRRRHTPLWRRAPLVGAAAGSRAAVACAAAAGEGSPYPHPPSPALVVGINKYSHDTSVAVVDAASSTLLYASAKERHSRRKHDGGGTAALVAHALGHLPGFPEPATAAAAVVQVVVNNHHERVASLEATDRLAFGVATGALPAAYAMPGNVLGSGPGGAGLPQTEVSHHLAHAASGVWGCGAAAALVVVMDGMGEAYREMAAASAGVAVAPPGDYVHDLQLPWAPGRHGDAHELPADKGVAAAPYGCREAESAYLYTAPTGAGSVQNGTLPLPLTRFWKRWAVARAPGESPNHGFEALDGVGAAYSRVASHIFGDWNACGKVQGLAAHGVAPAVDAPAAALGGVPSWLMRGDLTAPPGSPGAFEINWPGLAAAPYPNEWDRVPSGAGAPGSAAPCTDPRWMAYTALAAVAQRDLEAVTLTLLRSLRAAAADAPGAGHLVFVGGVALNSSLVGAIHRAAIFDTVTVPPAPGDEGIALGCAAVGAARWAASRGVTAPPPPPPSRLVPFTGAAYPPAAVDATLMAYAPWVAVAHHHDSADAVAAAADVLAAGGVVAWVDGRAELGARALGGRSLLAAATSPTVRTVLNDRVKRREAFRPFAPAVRAVDTDTYFVGPGASPWMSTCVGVRPEWAHRLPAVVHADGTARVQVVEPDTGGGASGLHALLEATASRTGVGVLLNTSANTAGEPLIETPADAVELLLGAMGGVELLVLDKRVSVTLQPSGLPPPPSPPPSPDAGDDTRGTEGHGRGAAAGATGDGATPPSWSSWGTVMVRLAPGTIPFSASTVTDAAGTVSRVSLLTGPRPPPLALSGGYVAETPRPPTAVELAAELDLFVLQALAASYGGEGMEMSDLADAFEDDDEDEDEDIADLNDSDAEGGGADVEEGDHGGVLARVRAAVRRLVDLRLVVAERGG